MANQNPLTAPLSAIKQMGEQATAAISSIGSGLSTMASQGIDTLMGGLPGLPGMGNSGKKTGFPTPQQLLPANLQQTLGQIENIIIPSGLPRPSQMLKTKQPVTEQPAAEAAAAAAAEKPAAGAAATAGAGVSEPSGAVPVRRRVMERRGL